MISLALRISALLSASLLAIGLLIAGGFYLQRDQDTGSGLRLPLPDQLAAMVELLENSPPAQRETLLRALNTPGLRLRVLPGPLLAQDGGEFKAFAKLIQSSLSAQGEHRVWAGIDPQTPVAAHWRTLGAQRALLAGAPLRIQIQLRGGELIDFQLRGALLRRLLQRPFWLLAWSLALLIALAALWALRRQLRPVEELALAVEKLRPEAPAQPLPEQGAPELRQLVRAYNRLQQRIHTLMESRTRMLAAISHDLGTYLTRLRLRIELIDNEEQRQHAERDLSEMQLLLRDSLALARMDDWRRRESVDLAVLAADELRACAAPTLQLQAPAAPLWVSGDALALRRVFANLLGNALKYAGGAELSLHAEAGWAEIRVEDRGPGLSAAEREQVLEPFYRGDRARNLDVAGSGLGLAIVADILRRHAGELLLEARPGGGLRVRARLPLQA